MNAKRFYFVMVGLVCFLGFGVLASAYFGNSLLSKQSQKLVSLKLDAHVADAQQTALTQAKKDIEKYSDLEQEAKVIVPQDKDQAAAVREIVKIAASSGIKLGSISFPSSNLGQTTTSPQTQSTTPAPTTTANKTAPVTQVQAVNGIPGVYAMQITIGSDAGSKVSYPSLISFLSKLEQNRRTAQVTSVSIQPDKDNPGALTFSLAVNVYIKP